MPLLSADNKARLKQALSVVGRRVPPRARRIALRSLAGSETGLEVIEAGDRYPLLQALAREHGLAGFVADGANGRIAGPIDDAIVLRVYAERGAWASESTARFVDALRDGGSYLDIGANLGLTTIPIAKRGDVRCVAFEPDPVNCAFLRDNLALNVPDAQVRVEQIALSDRAGSLRFERSPDNSGDHRLRVSDDEGGFAESAREVIEVQARRLDDLDLELPSPLTAKLDTQGSEPLVIAGGRRVLAGAQLMVLEFWPYGMSRTEGDVDGLLDFLRDNFHEGSLSVLDDERSGPWRSIGEVVEELRALNARARAEPHTHVDVFVRKR